MRLWRSVKAAAYLFDEAREAQLPVIHRNVVVGTGPTGELVFTRY
jgi:hypothetical protein